MISSAELAADSDSKILVFASLVTSSAALILASSLKVEVVDVVDEGEGEVVLVVVEDEIRAGGSVEGLVVVEDEIRAGGSVEGLVGEWFGGAKHLTAKGPLAKQKVCPG